MNQTQPPKQTSDTFTQQWGKSSGSKAAPKQPDAKRIKLVHKLSIFNLAFFVLAGILFVLIVVIEWQRMQYTNYQTEHETLVSSLPGETEVTQEQVKALESGFIDEPEIITFIETIEKARHSFDEFEMKFTSDVPEGKKAPIYLPLTLTLTGSYETVDRFLQSLFEAPYVLGVKNIELTSDDGFGTSSKLVLSAELYVSESFLKK